jgi:hypothetical protein
MTIDINSDHLLTLAEASRLLRGRPAVQTLARWCHKGCRGVRLSSCLIGGKRFVSREGLQQFADTLSEAVEGNSLLDSPAAKRRVSVKSSQILDEAGIHGG